MACLIMVVTRRKSLKKMRTLQLQSGHFGSRGSGQRCLNLCSEVTNCRGPLVTGVRSAFDSQLRGGDGALKAAARLAQGCVQMEQALRPAGTDIAQGCRSGNLSFRPPRDGIRRRVREALPVMGRGVGESGVPVCSARARAKGTRMLDTISRARSSPSPGPSWLAASALSAATGPASDVRDSSNEACTPA